MVKFKVTTESHQTALVKVTEGVLVLLVYVLPFSGHVYVSQAVCVSVDPVLLIMVRFNVTVESHPTALVKVADAVLLELVYVMPFNGQVYESQVV